LKQVSTIQLRSQDNPDAWRTIKDHKNQREACRRLQATGGPVAKMCRKIAMNSPCSMATSMKKDMDVLQNG